MIRDHQTYKATSQHKRKLAETTYLAIKCLGYGNCQRWYIKLLQINVSVNMKGNYKYKHI